MASSSHLYALLLSVLAICANAETVYHDLIFSRKFVSPDGFEKSALVVNGELIGPSIEAYIGDTIVVNVTNMAHEHEGFSIHWHGVHGIENVWHDGSSATNCPIPFGTSFRQTFTVLSEGTHFYHAHTGNVRAEGTYGAIVFKSRTPKHEFDAEFTLILSDWYHDGITELTTGLMSNPFKWVFNGNSILMNGKGLSQECESADILTNTTTRVTYPDGTVTESTSRCKGQRERILVEPGKTYLLRLINAASLGYYSFSIAGHSMTIIGTGSSPTVARVVNSVELSAGQRLEVLVTCNQEVLNPNAPSATHSFEMHVQSDYRGPDMSFAGIGNGYMTYVNTSTPSNNLNFDSISSLLPLHENREWHLWNPLLNQDPTHAEFKAPPQSSVASHVFNTQQEWVNTMTGKGFEPAVISPESDDESVSLAWTVNGQRLVLPRTPLQLTSYINQGVQNPSLVRLNINDVVDITVQNTVAGNGVCESHPWHIHNSPAWLIGEGPGAFNPATDPANYNLVDPPYVDTVTNFPSVHNPRRNATVFGKGAWQTPCGWFTLRIQISRPGMWFFHCHIDWHMTMGMGVVLDVESEKVDKYPSDMPLCGDVFASDVYREDSDDVDENFTFGEIIAIVMAVIAVIIVVLIFLYKYLSAKSSGPMTGITNSPLHDADRQL